MSVTSPQSVGIQTGSIAGRTAKTQRGLWDKYFYFAMSLLMTVVVVYGFSLTMGARIIHPKTAPPQSFTSMRLFFTDGWRFLFFSRLWCGYTTCGCIDRWVGFAWGWAW